MTNPNPPRIPDNKRGHRKPLAPGEKTIAYQIKLPESLHERVTKAGPVRLRELISAAFAREKNDTLDIDDWAKKRCDEMRREIKSYIADGWEKTAAVERVLNVSTIGAGYKAQIRYEFK